MLFLSASEKKEWAELVEDVVAGRLQIGDVTDRLRPNLIAVFRCCAAARLFGEGRIEEGRRWFAAGVMEEEDGFFFNAFVTAFLERHGGKLLSPTVCFADPRPFVHFSGVPVIKESRQRFLRHCADSMPVFRKPLRMMDLGCGNGALAASLVSALRDAGKVADVGEVLLVDSSPAMVGLAAETLGKNLPASRINAMNTTIQKVSTALDSKYDIVLSSLAYHHMPLEQKRVCLERLQPWFDHFVIFELDANNDTPEIHSPEIACSTYQAYGRVIDLVFEHDAPIDVAQACVDCFLMVEAVSLLTEPRGVRSEYHMLRGQWTELFERVLAPEFGCMCNSTCYADECIDLFAMHYGR